MKTMVLVAVGCAAVGCAPSEDTFVNYERDPGTVQLPDDATPSQPVAPGDARAYFEAEVEADLVAACGACHTEGSAKFLLSPVYGNIQSYGFIGEDPASSLILTYPNSAEHIEEHMGRSWQGLAPLRERVLAWLTLEAASFEPRPYLEIGPIDPVGQVTLPLAGLGDEYEHVAMTFFTAELGDPVTALWLTDVEVWPRFGQSIRVDNITLVVLPEGGDAEVLDESMHRAPFTVTAPDGVTVSDEVVLTQWSAGARLAVRFDDLQVTP